MRIAIGADHGGFELKEEIKNFLKEKEYDILDFGTDNCESVDYPPLAFKTANSVARGESHFGIFVCGSGVGASIAANKVQGIRAALCYNTEIARLSREHNNANFLCLGGRFTGKEDALKIVEIWLKTPFAGGRHERRIKQIEEIEKKCQK